MCHATIARLFKESPHYFEQTNEEAARCIDCHGDHNVSGATTVLYEGEEEGHCGSCHEADSKQVRLAKLIKGRIETGINELETAALTLQKVADSGKSLAEVEEAYETARSELVKARAAAHTLDIERINEHINPAVEEAEKVQKASAGILYEISGRRKGSILVLAILGIIMAAVFAKIRSLKTEE
jgi:predicted ATPase with chaperone activity